MEFFREETTRDKTGLFARREGPKVACRNLGETKLQVGFQRLQGGGHQTARHLEPCRGIRHTQPTKHSHHGGRGFLFHQHRHHAGNTGIFRHQGERCVHDQVGAQEVGMSVTCCHQIRSCLSRDQGLGGLQIPLFKVSQRNTHGNRAYQTTRLWQNDNP